MSLRGRAADVAIVDAPIADTRLTRADARFGLELRARILSALFAAGATLALLTAALPHSSRANLVGGLAGGAIAYVVAALLFWQARHLAADALPIALAGGTTLITAVA